METKKGSQTEAVKHQALSRARLESMRWKVHPIQGSDSGRHGQWRQGVWVDGVRLEELVIGMVDQAVLEKQRVVFQFVVEGAPVVYQWFKDNVALVDHGRVMGSTSATLQIAGAEIDLGFRDDLPRWSNDHVATIWIAF
jgi:hypothetical protein